MFSKLPSIRFFSPKYSVKLLETRYGWLGIVYRNNRIFSTSFPHSSKTELLDQLAEVKLPRDEYFAFNAALSDPEEITLKNEDGSVSDPISNDFTKLLAALEGKHVAWKWEDLELAGYTPEEQRVLKAIFQIPHKSLRSYGEIAKEVGKQKAARFVGYVASHNRFPLIVPCHRVIAKSGLGGFRGSKSRKTLEHKLELLAKEGVAALSKLKAQLQRQKHRSSKRS